MLGWEAVPPFHTAPAPLFSHTIHIQSLREQVSGGVATYEELDRSWSTNYGPSLLKTFYGHYDIVRQVVVNELSVFLNILLEPTFLAALFAELFEVDDC